jgi:hypothetical protein
MQLEDQDRQVEQGLQVDQVLLDLLVQQTEEMVGVVLVVKGVDQIQTMLVVLVDQE